MVSSIGNDLTIQKIILWYSHIWAYNNNLIKGDQLWHNPPVCNSYPNQHEPFSGNLRSILLSTMTLTLVSWRLHGQIGMVVTYGQGITVIHILLNVTLLTVVRLVRTQLHENVEICTKIDNEYTLYVYIYILYINLHPHTYLCSIYQNSILQY